jgi:hypothetical protein
VDHARARKGLAVRATAALATAALALLLGGCFKGSGGGGSSAQPAPEPTTALEASGSQGPLTAGTSPTLVVIVRSSTGAVLADYRGTIAFSSTDPQATLPGPYTFTAADAGVHAFVGEIFLRTAGTQTVTLGDTAGGVTAGTYAVTITAAVLDHFTVVLPAVQQNGVAFASGTISARDAFGNQVPGFDASADPVAVTVAPADGAVSLVGRGAPVLDLASDFSGGQASLGGLLRFSGALGAHTFTVRSASGIEGSGTTTIAGTTLFITGLPARLGAGDSAAFVVVARDPSGAVDTGYRGTVAFDSSDPQAIVPPDYAFDATDAGVHLFPSVTFRTAGTQTLTVDDGTGRTVAGSASVSVDPAGLDHLVFALPTQQVLNVPFTAGSLTAKDAFGNTVTTFDASADRVTITVSPTATLSGNVFSSASDFTGGTASLTSRLTISGQAAGSYTLTATSASGKTGTGQVVLRSAQTFFEISALPANVAAGQAQSFVVIARDSAGVVPFTGTIRFSSSDPLASKPADFTFQASDGGIHAFPSGVTFRTSGSQTLRATDVTDPTTTGGATVTVAPGAATSLVLALPATQQQSARFASGTLTAKDAWGNVATAFDASQDNVTLTIDTPEGTLTGLGSGNGGVLNRAADFTAGVASLTQLKYTGPLTSVTFRATSARGLASGTQTVSFFDPFVSGLAQFLDVNGNSSVDQGDQVLLPFGTAVTVSGSPGATTFSLPVSGDSLGSGASAALLGGTNNVVKITLGSSPHLKVRQRFNASRTGLNDASGIDVAPGQSAIKLASSNVNVGQAQPNPYLDIVPGFVEKTQTAGALAQSAAIAADDFDQNGTVDIAIAAGGLVRILKNDGSGLFTTSNFASAGNDVRAVAAGLRDDKGRRGFVIANFGGDLAVYMVDLGTGVNPTFVNGLRLSWTTVAVADFDGDGFPDFAGGAGQAQGTRIYLSDRRSNYLDAGEVLPTGNVTSIAAGDVDGDGRPDIVVGASDQPIHVFLNRNPNVTFDDTLLPVGSGGTLKVALADVNGDGALDIVEAVSTEIRVYLGNGAGAFTSTGRPFGRGTSPTFALADVDADGRPDAIVAFGAAAQGRLFMNDGTGIFADAGPALGSEVVLALVAADLDRDGDTDVFLTRTTANTFPRVFRSSLTGAFGSVSFTPTPQIIDASSNPTTELLFDVDGDGDLDIVRAPGGAVTAKLEVFLNNGTGTYTALTQLRNFAFASATLAAGDVDGDGDVDLVVGNSGQPTRVLLNNGRGIFSDGGTIATLSATAVLLLPSDNRTAAPDLVIGTTTGASSYQNDGHGQFTFVRDIVTGQSVTALAAIDLDRDKAIDLVIGQGNNVAATYLGQGDGTFTARSTLTLPAPPSSFAVGDVDRDGDQDLAIGFRGPGNQTRIYKSDGRGTLTLGTTLTSGLGNTDTTCLAFADVNQDGKLDLIQGNLTLATRVYAGDGTGLFADLASIDSNVPTVALGVGDVDGDGDLDVVTTNAPNSVGRVYKNQ